jgi:alpha-mannosidase
VPFLQLRFVFLGLVCLTSTGVLAQKSTFQKRDLTKGNTMYVVPYAHLDTQWRWAYPQVIREYIPDTLNQNFALIDKYPNYIFNFSGSRRYQFMKEYYPTDYDKLKRYIKAGRWFPCGSSVDEGDANVPSAEALIRHQLYGNRFFKKEFGIYSQEFMLPDCFGFPYALPSILAHSGTNAFSTQKLTWGSAVGIPFKIGNWEGPDGRSVVAALDPGSYAGDVDEDLSQNTSWLARIQNTGKISGAFVDYHYYGTGDQGGGPTESSVDWVEKSIKGTGPVTVVSSRADDMFRSLTKGQMEKLPRYKGELLLTEHSAGSVTSQAYMKRWNRKNELLADAAERASVAAMWLGGRPYPTERLYNAWDLVLGSQMHDMLPGTSIPKAYEFCWNDELLALNQFGAIRTDAISAISSAMDTSGDGQAIIVYNPLSVYREDIVEVSLPTWVLTKKFQNENQPHEFVGAQVYGPDGPVKTQVLSADKSFIRLAFLARVGSCSFGAYRIKHEATAATGSDLTSSQPNEIENAKFKVTVNDAGDIASIFDKQNNREVLNAPARLDFQYHNPSAFPAWNMDWEDAKRPPAGYVDGKASVRVVEKGPVRSSIRVQREAMGSKFLQEIRLSSGDAGDRVEIYNVIDWKTGEHALKASFPLTTGNPLATYDLQVGAIQRGNNDEKKYEVPQHQWIDLSQPDGKYGVGILNDSKYGSDKPNDDTIRLTLLYTPGVRGGYWDQATQDFGRHEIVYAVAPHTGDWRATPWIAKRLNQPLQAFAVPSHEGPLGKSLSLLSCNTSQVEVTAIKKAEDSNEIIVRLRELEGKPADVVRISVASGIGAAREVDGQERPLGAATIKSGELVTSVSPFSLRAFALKLGKAPAKASPPQAMAIELPYDTKVSSSASKPAEGSFDSIGHSIPSELLPATLTVSGINFKVSKVGPYDAVSCAGQDLKLPSGSSDLYILAAAESDIFTEFKSGNAVMPARIQSWDGYVGLWDNRLWNADLGVNYTHYTEWRGLVPAYEKGSEVAWFSNHKRNPKTVNDFYEYCYLYLYRISLPENHTTLTLPNDKRIKIVAISASKKSMDLALPAQFGSNIPVTSSSAAGQPLIAVSGASNDVTTVTITPPLYWRKGGLRYTTDGSDPTAASPTYDGPFSVYEAVTLKAAEIGDDGKVGTVVLYNLNTRDKTAPTIVGGTSVNDVGAVRLRFSEPLEKSSAETVSNYRFSEGTPATAKLMADGQTVEITLASPVSGIQPLTVTINRVKDKAPTANVLRDGSTMLVSRGAVFKSPSLQPKTPREFRPENLPVKATDSWTLNLFCKVDATPEHLTLIGGFGRAIDGRTGMGRYFASFNKGINFWICNRDVGSDVPLDLSKWQMLTATFDGQVVRVYKNGQLIAEEANVLRNDEAQVAIMPIDAWDRKRVFQGEVRDVTIWDESLSDTVIKRLWETAPK